MLTQGQHYHEMDWITEETRINICGHLCDNHGRSICCEGGPRAIYISSSQKRHREREEYPSFCKDFPLGHLLLEPSRRPYDMAFICIFFNHQG